MGEKDRKKWKVKKKWRGKREVERRDRSGEGREKWRGERK